MQRMVGKANEIINKFDFGKIFECFINVELSSFKFLAT